MTSEATNAQQAHGTVSTERTRKPSTILVVAAFAAFLATFNETFLNVGFAPIMESLSVDVSTVQWLATAYMLGAAVMVPVSAFAYRSFPTRQLFCATTALLVIGSVIGALAPNFSVLLAGRIVQALGTGMLIPIGMNITLEVAPREKLGTYMGIMGATTTLGPSSSVILAGVILAFFEWSMLLWVFAGLSLLCFLAGAIILRDIAHLTHPKLDAPSVALIAIALIGILYGISTIFSGNVVFAVASIVVGAAVLVVFVVRQGKLAEPLIDLRPLKIPPFAVGLVVNMLSLITIFAMNIIVPTFMQSALSTPPLVASLILFPAILCSCVISPLAGRIYDKQGPGVLLPLGFLCIAVFSVLTAAFIATANPVLLAIIYIPVICGSAFIIGPVQSYALSKLSPEDEPARRDRHVHGLPDRWLHWFFCVRRRLCCCWRWSGSIGRERDRRDERWYAGIGCADRHSGAGWFRPCTLDQKQCEEAGFCGSASTRRRMGWRCASSYCNRRKHGFWSEHACSDHEDRCLYPARRFDRSGCYEALHGARHIRRSRG